MVHGESQGDGTGNLVRSVSFGLVDVAVKVYSPVKDHKVTRGRLSPEDC